MEFGLNCAIFPMRMRSVPTFKVWAGGGFDEYPRPLMNPCPSRRLIGNPPLLFHPQLQRSCNASPMFDNVYVLRKSRPLTLRRRRMSIGINVAMSVAFLHWRCGHSIQALCKTSHFCSGCISLSC